MRNQARNVVAATMVALILGILIGLIAYVLDAETSDEQDHRAQVVGTIFGVAVVVPTAVGWAWRAVAAREHLDGANDTRRLPTPPSGRILDLSGDWYAAWQSYKDGEEVIAVQPVSFAQDGVLIDVETLDRGRPVEDGGYHWNGELRLWDNEILMGWYASIDSSVRSKGTLYFVLHPQGRQMIGRWVGLSFDGKIVTGWGAMAHSDEEVRQLLTGLRENGRNDAN